MAEQWFAGDVAAQHETKGNRRSIDPTRSDPSGKRSIEIIRRVAFCRVTPPQWNYTEII